MIQSMTGFGEAACELNGISYVVEIKTVNNRYFKSSVKLPDTVAFLEEDVDRLLRSSIARGTVMYNLRMKNVAAKAMFNIDEVAVRTCVQKLGDIAGKLKVDYKIDLAALLNLPGVIEPVLPDEDEAKRISDTILKITAKAIEQLKKMRDREGQSLAADLIANCAGIKEKLDLIRQKAPMVIVEYHKKLKKRVEELTSQASLKLDDETMAREVAFFAERSDISEELSRLESHLGQFSHSLESTQQAGRRLDFIGQEMLREANTIGSKSMDSDIAKWVVDIKCMIDRIKEQVQNVE